MKLIFSLLTLFLIPFVSPAQDTLSIPLYNGNIPNSIKPPANYFEKTKRSGKGFAEVTNPEIIAYYPANNGARRRTAVIICPGGSYKTLSGLGNNVALWFNKIGIVAFVLKYRLPNDLIMVNKSIGPIEDAQTAIAMVRKNAVQWNIDPQKIGIIGFSAGGHLASTVGTHYDRSFIDNPDHISLRPDFMMLAYPVISFGAITHLPTKQNLIGRNPADSVTQFFSNEKHVTKDTPPTFIVVADDDQVVPSENSKAFYNALVKQNVKAEIHVYPKGGHGFGLVNKQSSDRWTTWAYKWLQVNGFI